MNLCVRNLRMLMLLFVAACVSPAAAQKAPQETLESLKKPEGWNLSLFASEPMITNPAAIDIDTHGRVWVAEIQWYRKSAKQPPADKIKVLEDTNGDGKADRATVFADGLFCPMSVCVAGDKVYVATSPDLWVYEDKNGDLKADGPPQKLLTGFGGFNHDHGAHSLVLGPDHKWWMSHGDTGFNVTGTDGSKIEFKWGAMLRGELDGSKLETVAVNFRNPYEIAVSSFGEAFCSDNDNDGNFSVRICWILEGGNYGWFGGPPFKKEELATRVPPGTPYREHWHFRGFTPGFVPATLVTGFGSPCGMCFYEGDAFGSEFKNVPLHADAGPREVRAYRHAPAGYGMTASSRNLITTEGDNYFRPDDICTAPDGSLYISDWYDGGVGGHAYNDPDRGRIYLARPQGKPLARTSKPGPYANATDAVEGLKSPNLATQFLARERLLADAATSVPLLKKLASDVEPNYKARALWLLDRIGGEARVTVVEQLKSDDPAFRALAARILRRHGDKYAGQILALSDDPSGEVRREVLLLISKLNSPLALETLARMTPSFDGRDRYQLEALHIAAGERKQDLFALLEKQGKWSFEQLPLMQLLNPQAAAAYVVANLSKSGLDASSAKALLDAAGNAPTAEAGQSLVQLAASENASIDLRRAALAKVAANLAGAWKPLASDEAFLTALKQMLDEPALQREALAIVREQGLGRLGGAVRALAAKTSADPQVRAEAIAVAARLPGKDVAGDLRKLLDDAQPAVKQAALHGLIDLQDSRSLREILSRDTVDAKLQSQAVERLISSTGGALVLLRLLDEKKLAPQLAQQTLVKATSHPDANIRVLYEKYIPEAQRPQRLGAAIKATDILALKADAKRGENIFFQSSAAQCKNCHAVNGQGTPLGPDLSQIGRKYERATLLETILDPSKAISHEYVPYLLETEGGQVFAGFLVEKSDQQVVLRDIKNQLIRVPAQEVATLEQQQKSLMPELVLRDVTAQDAADLLAYLASLNSNTQHVGRFRLMGPFPSGDNKGIETAFPPEEHLASIDLDAKYRGARRMCTWEEVQCETKGGLTAFDQVRYSQQHGLPSDQVTCYYAVFADSAADQPATLLIGSDDANRVWVNGQEVHRFKGSRAVGFAQDKVPVQLKSGRNTIILKVENYSGPGGVALSIQSTAPLEMRTQ